MLLVFTVASNTLCLYKEQVPISLSEGSQSDHGDRWQEYAGESN